MAVQVKFTPDGRMSLPAEIGMHPGLALGGTLIVEELGDGEILRSLAQSISHAHDIARVGAGGGPNASVDAFIAGRKADNGE